MVEARARQAVIAIGTRSGANELHALLPGLICGLLLLWPGDTFTTGLSYTGLAFWSENLWGALHLGAASLGSAAGFAGHYVARRLSMLLSVCLWSATTALLVSGNPIGFGWTFLSFVLAGVSAYLQLGGQRAEREATAKAVALLLRQGSPISGDPPRC